ncbi:hypothetical protein FTUN_1195 [Frigoriglobus tundricola]|uniref:Uncharacterized protein n=1 Tax=Frigoriglobus tundricola TaxID=2774151 RepID=A0A6M5YI09_9BACT|nr:hypothetical protein FTUN_1195 [Frigoriglobus tundricola]
MSATERRPGVTVPYAIEWKAFPGTAGVFLVSVGRLSDPASGGREPPEERNTNGHSEVDSGGSRPPLAGVVYIPDAHLALVAKKRARRPRSQGTRSRRPGVTHSQRPQRHAQPQRPQ